MQTARLTLHSLFTIDAVDDRIFGGFLEHIGRSIYEGVYDPESRHADADGMRTDVIDALRELALTVVRYPGGNFTSGYHWEEGVGPRESRPCVRELAWQSIETNHFGTDEFINLCRKLDWIPMIAVNLGTGSPEEACNWVEYCNGAAGTRYADLRAANGSSEPHAVPLWCLGNEMDGPWQLGHMPAELYAIRAQQAAKMMKDCDRAIETVVCGSSAPMMPTFPAWDRTVMEKLSGLADHVSLHRYVGNPDNNPSDYLAVSKSIDAQIEAVAATARYVQALRPGRRRIHLCFDEWNVWYRARTGSHIDGRGKFAPALVEEEYNFEDALVVAMFLMSFIRHADCVKVANLAQLVNVIAPIRTLGDNLLKQTIFHAFRMISSRKGGTAMHQHIVADGYDSTSYGHVPYLDSAAMMDGDLLKVFTINRHLDESMALDVRVADRAIAEVVSAELLHADSLDAQNTVEDPDNVQARVFTDWELDDGARAEIPAHALVATTFRLA